MFGQWNLSVKLRISYHKCHPTKAKNPEFEYDISWWGNVEAKMPHKIHIPRNPAAALHRTRGVRMDKMTRLTLSMCRDFKKSELSGWLIWDLQYVTFNPCNPTLWSKRYWAQMVKGKQMWRAKDKIKVSLVSYSKKGARQDTLRYLWLYPKYILNSSDFRIKVSYWHN